MRWYVFKEIVKVYNIDCDQDWNIEVNKKMGLNCANASKKTDGNKIIDSRQ